jgi:hypothetical protein
MTANRATALVLTALLAASFAACGDDDDNGSKPAKTTTTVAVAEGLRPFPTDTVPLPDGEPQPQSGEIAAYISAVDVEAHTITVNYIEFLTGDAANAAYQEDTGSTEPVPDDYYIRDTAQEDVPVDVADDVEVTIIESTDAGAVSNAAATFADVEAASNGGATPFWLTFADGKVTAINAQYVP